MPYEVFHITEFVDQSMREGGLKLRKKRAVKITCHDACHLGRQGEPWQAWIPQSVKRTDPREG